MSKKREYTYIFNFYGNSAEQKPTGITRADAIRGMSDEELAKVLYNTENTLDFCKMADSDVFDCPLHDGGATDDDCMNCLLEWLRGRCEGGGFDAD